MQKLYKDKGIIQLSKKGIDDIQLYFKSAYNAYYYHKELGQIKAEEGFDDVINAKQKDVVNLYLSLKTFEDSFRDNSNSVIFEENGKRVLFYVTENRPMTLSIKGIDYENNRAGIFYVDVLSYQFILFLSYLKKFLDTYEVYTFSLEGIDFSYNKKDKILLIRDSNMDKFHFITHEEVVTMQEILDNYLSRSALFTHSFTPDENIVIDRDTTFYVNGKALDFSVFKKVVYLTTL